MKIKLKLLFCMALMSSCNAQKSAIIAEGAELTLVADGYEFTEGPAVAANGDVYFTDQPNDRIVKWDASTNTVADWMQPSGRANGLYFDHKGNLLACADENTELWSIDPEKKVTVLLKTYMGKKFGGPNDLWVDPKGGIYFTDPYYQRPWWNYTEPEIKERRVYYFTPETGEIKIATEGGYGQPNGIVGSADGKTLYVADNGNKKTYAFTINDDGSLSDKKLFADMGSDGMTIDNLGNVYLTGNGVTIFDSTGKQINHIKINKGWTANVTFGGKDQDILFITAMDAVYTLKMNVRGIR